MKKFFYVALMALAVALTSCGVGVGQGNSDYYKGGKEPQIDFDKATVNGIAYNNTDKHCYKFTVKTTTLGITVGADDYMWGTEFDLVAACEYTMFTVAQTGISKASYSYVIEVGADQNKCEELSEKAGN